MRQKVGKERSQGDCHPLGYPPLFSDRPPENVRPCAHPLEALQNPGWSAQRHRRGRRCKTSQLTLPQARPGFHYDGHRQRLRTNNKETRPRARPPAPAYGVRCPPRTAMLCIATGSAKLLHPTLGRDLPMTADATPGGRPVPLGTRTGQPLPQTEAGDSTNRNSLRSLALPLASTGAARHSAWAIRARNILCPRALGNHSR